MAIDKRHNRKWNGVAWVEIFHPTSADLIYVTEADRTISLSEKLGEIDEHPGDPTLHLSTTEAAAVANLPADTATALSGLRTDLDTHTGKTDIHVSKAQKDVLDDLTGLPDLPSEVFATKDEVAGKKETYTYEDITERDNDLINFTTDEIGTHCWVKDPSADVENIPEGKKGAAEYVLISDGDDGVMWDFLFQAGDADLTVNWIDIVDKPSSTTTQIDSAVSKAHGHTNAAVIDALTDGGLDGLLYKGVQVGGVYSQTYYQDEEPENPNVGDTWLAPIEDV